MNTLSESDQRKLLAEIDDFLGKTQKYTSPMLHLQANNAAEQLKIFLEKNGNYAPQFTYKRPSKSLLNALLDQLIALKKSHIENITYTLPCAQLFADKIQERIWETELLLAYIDQDFGQIKLLNSLIYGTFNQQLLEEAKEILHTYQEAPASTWGKKLQSSEIINILKTYLKQHHISDIMLKPLAFSQMKFMLAYQKSGCMLIFPNNLITREHMLMANIIHEIGTHYQRYVNGKKYGRNLINHGTAFYKIDEEGLAMYQAYLYLNKIYPGFHKTSMYQKYYILAHADGKSYQDICAELKGYSPNSSLTSLFKKIVRMYAGVKDTSQEGISFFKYNKIYLDGFAKIKKRHQQGNDLQRLLIGKIKIEDIDIIHQMPDKKKLS